MGKNSMGISKTLVIIVIAAIVIVAAVVGAWWFFLREEAPIPGVSLSVSPAPTGVEDSGGYAKPGESVTVSGSTSPVVDGAEVTLTYTQPDSNVTRVTMGVPLRSNFTRTTTTDDDGKFTDTYSVASTDPTGKWTVAAEIRGNTSEPADFNIFTDTPIKIGVIRNLFVQGDGMEEASIMAAEDINDAGGISGRKVIVAFGDEGTEATTGVAEITRLITVEDVDFLTGGFRTEIVIPMKEVAMDYQKIFIITGAATTELFNSKGSYTMPDYKDNVEGNYERYKYMFRVMPPNSSLLFTGCLIPYLADHLVPMLGGSEEEPVKVAAVIENLAWCDLIATIYDGAFPLAFPPTMEKVRDKSWRPGHLDTDFSSILTAIEDRGAELIIHVFSGEAGLAYVKQWGEMEIPAVTIGIDVLSQNSDMWTDTDGKCEYEAFISSPPRVNLTAGLIPWWDRYVERWGHDPVYTSLGAYDAIFTLKFGIETAGSLDSDDIVVALEGSERDTLMGRGSFDKYHDVLIIDSYPMNEHKEWVTPLIVQWRDGQREVLFPFERTYSTEYEFPPWITPP